MFKNRFFLFALIAVAVIMLMSGYLLYNQLSSKMILKPAAKAEPIFKYFSQLDGRGVVNQTEVAPQVVGIMVDNHPDAWPPSGLSEAKIVYEALAEGGITRFLALFEGAQTTTQAGPVRSARPYYLDWLREYGDALYLHSGGSPEALALIKRENIFDANEFWWGPYYWREAERSAPHNLYTSGERWQKILARETERAGAPWTGWPFGALSPATGEPLKAVLIKYYPGYTVSWSYDESGRFKRLVNGTEFLDDAGAPIWADNILIQFAASEILDALGRRRIYTLGEGEARALRDGQMIRAEWKKQNPAERTRFYDSAGAEIALKSGVTWVEVVPQNTVVEVTN